ncbi:hypothetical protein [Vibrio sp. Hal054]|uniref:hypothetical protein n=1 Tax=Vibrio sp. Hal054 TaxID=3035158 RepID=UPI00301CD81A
MTDIFINLDEPVFAPTMDMTLLEMFIAANYTWFDDVTCITQESDGEIIHWTATAVEVQAARLAANVETGLIPVVGFEYTVHSEYYDIEDVAYVANDWRTAVVTKAQFENATKGGSNGSNESSSI